MNDLVVGLILIFGPSTAGVLWLGYQAHRGNPAVVTDDPWDDTDDAAWDRLAAAVQAARDDVEREAIDLALWDAEVTR